MDFFIHFFFHLQCGVARSSFRSFVSFYYYYVVKCIHTLDMKLETGHASQWETVNNYCVHCWHIKIKIKTKTLSILCKSACYAHFMCTKAFVIHRFYCLAIVWQWKHQHKMFERLHRVSGKTILHGHVNVTCLDFMSALHTNSQAHRFQAIPEYCVSLCIHFWTI